MISTAYKYLHLSYTFHMPDFFITNVVFPPVVLFIKLWRRNGEDALALLSSNTCTCQCSFCAVSASLSVSSRENVSSIVNMSRHHTLFLLFSKKRGKGFPFLKWTIFLPSTKQHFHIMCVFVVVPLHQVETLLLLKLPLCYYYWDR